MRVEVYKNLHASRAQDRPVYSLRDARTRRVVGRAPEVLLADVRFKVSEAGRQRVLRERAKNVHAFVCGDAVDSVPEGRWRRARYNPYEVATFVDAETGQPLEGARYARVGPDGITYLAA